MSINMKKKTSCITILLCLIFGVASSQSNITGFRDGDKGFKEFIYKSISNNGNLWHSANQYFFVTIKFAGDNISKIQFSGCVDSILKDDIELLLVNTKGMWKRSKDLSAIIVLHFVLK